MKKIFFIAAAACLALSAHALEYQREDWNSNLVIGNRPNQVGTTKFLPRTQLWYGMYQNLLHRWVDRPLEFDRETRYSGTKYLYLTAPSLKQELKTMHEYELDAFSAFCNGCMNHIFLNAMTFMDANPIGRNFLFPDYQGEPGQTLKGLGRYLNQMKNSRAIFRVNGKIPFATYGISVKDAVQFEQEKQELIQKHGDIFLLLGSGGAGIGHWENIMTVWRYLETGRISEDYLKKLEKGIERALTYFDGIQIGTVNRYREPMGDYMLQMRSEYYKNIMVPLLNRIFAKEQFKNKMLMAFVEAGYINHRSGDNMGEFGTSTLRNGMENAMLLNPDFIMLSEWNEYNENSIFRPTLNNSDAKKRLVRYYIREVRKQTQTPLKGDDTAIPNLILSARQTVKTGEPLQFELLHVPDGSGAEYTAQLKLKDSSGRLLQTFPEERFVPEKLRAVTYTIPSEQLAENAAVYPEIEINGQRTFNGFDHVRIRPTFCVVYKSIHQPLRSLAQPEQVKFSVARTDDGHYKIDADIQTGEPISSFELLDNEVEVYADDRANEFDRENSVQLMFLIGGRCKFGNYEMVIRVDHSKDWKYFPSHAYNDSFGVNLRKKGDEVRGIVTKWGPNHRFFLTIPKAEADKAAVRIAFNGKETVFKVSDLKKYGKMAGTQMFDGMMRIDADYLNRMPDIPVRVNDTQAAIHTVLKSDFRFPVYSLRMVTTSGKIYRSAPVVPVSPSGENCEMNVFSEATRKLIRISQKKDVIPVCRYIFDPAAGAVLRNTWEPYYDAQLGGGFNYCDAFFETPLKPKQLNAPQWVKENDRWLLRFDGVAQYIAFPLEAFPRGEFTLKFSIRPEDSGKPMVLFRHYNMYMGSISIFLKNGKLTLAFPDENQDESLNGKIFTPDAMIPFGKWSDIAISYDCRKITFRINGKTCSFPITAKAWEFKTAIFGGHTRIQWGINEPMTFFKGDLRSFMIGHKAEHLQ